MMKKNKRAKTLTSIAAGNSTILPGTTKKTIGI
jgi:hypothetical protein